jgi:predicted ATP-dependent endonuclease of OLD family
MAKKSEKPKAEPKVTIEPTTANDGLKFIHLDLENFKNIRKTEVEIGGKSIMIVGRNGQGKSSLIQALMSPLDTKQRPTEPITVGEEKASISVTIGGKQGGEEKEYILDIHFTEKDKKGRLVVKDALTGELIKSPASFLDSIIGNVSFHVTKWLGESKENKLKLLKDLTGKSKEIDIINMSIHQQKEDLKAAKKRVEALKAVMGNHGYTQEEIDKYSTKIDTAPLLEQMTNISDSITKYTEFEGRLKTLKDNQDSMHKSLTDMDIKIQEYRDAIANLEMVKEQTVVQISENAAKIQKGNEFIANNAKPSAEGISAQITEATKHNEQCDAIKSLSEKNKELIETQDSLVSYETKIKDLEKNRAEIISKSQLKIDGFSFDNDNIYLNGLPLEEGQVNSAALFDVGVEIAMALNPGLKTIFLHDGSLFDKVSLKKIIEKIENNGYQAIIEMVDYNGGDLEVKFTEKELG